MVPLFLRERVGATGLSLVARRTFLTGAVATLMPDVPVMAQTSMTAGAKVNVRRAAEARQGLLKGVRNWGYQLRRIDFDRVAQSAHDLVVIEFGLSKALRFERMFMREEIARARIKPDGSLRIVLAYLSIGEAERYRPYWDRAWEEPGKAPAWLGPMNPRWVENYPVRFWDPEWQRLIVEGPSSYLAHILGQGFDGIYLDRADVFQEWRQERPQVENDMVAWVQRVAQVARAQRPEFLVVLQNAEELLEHSGVLTAIDGIAKEDLLFGLDFAGGVNPPDEVAAALKPLQRAKRAGKTVLVVEYVGEASKIAHLASVAQREGFLPHVADRTLWRMNEPPISSFIPTDVVPPP
jgi:cysteinyl-tRNA synthetase, unknown class